MKFKEENATRLEDEWKSPRLDPMVKKIVNDAAAYAAEKWEWEFTITSIFRTQDEDDALDASGVHVYWRAVDVRTKDQSKAAVNDVADYVNQKYQYDPQRKGLKVCFKEVHGTAPHAHFQVHQNTVEKTSENRDSDTRDVNKIIEKVDISRQFYYEMTPRRLAILDLIAFTEGTDQEIGKTKKGYDIFFTGRRFTNFSKHPRKVHCAGRLCSSAAGRYQFLADTWDWLQKRLKNSGFEPFPSFEPVYQDQAALFLIDAKRKAMGAVDSGDLHEFLDLCSFEWASMPDPDTGKGHYGQPIYTVKKIRDVYNELFDLWNA